MSKTFIGRKKELNELNKRYLSNKKEFGIIYGRRRIGKSELIKEFIKDKNGILFQAKKDNNFGNLKSFSKAVNEKINNNIDVLYSSWGDAFKAISSFYNSDRYIVAIDEYPYILKQDPSFASLIQEIVDNAGDNLFLIISGSDVSLLKNEIENHSSPLYKRKTFQMQIKQMNLKESLEFLRDFDIETKSKYLSLFSTYPYYLNAIDSSLDFDSNIINLLFNEYGIFYDLPDQILSNSTNVQDVYNAILYAISKRKRTIKDISEFIHEPETKVNKYLTTLLNSELISKNTMFLANSRNTYYEISDPLIRFWYSIIFENKEKISFNGEVMYSKLKDTINLFLSTGFEDISRLYINQLNQDGKLDEIFPSIKPFKAEKTKLGRSIEIDGISLSNDVLMVLETKFRTVKFNLKMFEHLKESTSIFPEKYKRIYFLFSKSGFTNDIENLKGKNIHLITLEDILRIE